MFPEAAMQQAGTQTNDTSAQTQTEESYQIDENARIEVKDPTADFNVVIPPPIAGEYPIKWKAGEKGIEFGGSQRVGTFLNVFLTGELIAEGTDYNGYSVNEYMNTIYNKIKGTTEVHHFLNCLGQPLPLSIGLKDVKTTLETLLANSPIGAIELEWQAKEKNPGDRRADKNGYVTLKNAMRQFPKNQDGSYQNWVPSGIDGSPVYATAYVLKHLKK